MYQQRGLQDIKNVMNNLSLVWPPGLIDLISSYFEVKINIKWDRDSKYDLPPVRTVSNHEVHSGYGNYKCIYHDKDRWLKIIYPLESNRSSTVLIDMKIHKDSIIFDINNNLWFVSKNGIVGMISTAKITSSFVVQKYNIGSGYTAKAIMGSNNIEWICGSYLDKYDSNGNKRSHIYFNEIISLDRIGSVNLLITYCDNSYYIVLDNKLFKWNGNDHNAENKNDSATASYNLVIRDCEAVNIVPIENKIISLILSKNSEKEDKDKNRSKDSSGSKIEPAIITMTSDRNGNLLFLCHIKEYHYQVWCLQLSSMISYFVCDLRGGSLNKIQVNFNNDIIVSSSKMNAYVKFDIPISVIGISNFT